MKVPTEEDDDEDLPIFLRRDYPGRIINGMPGWLWPSQQELEQKIAARAAKAAKKKKGKPND
jgi:hypothetical protein